MRSKDKLIITKILKYIDEIKMFINGYSHNLTTELNELKGRLKEIIEE